MMMGSRGSEKRQLQQAPRRGRRFDEEAPTTTTATCRSCAAVAIADCVALGCCPCAVVSLLGLALVKAPLAVGRRCVARLRTRRRFRLLLRKKRVRDADAVVAPCARGKAAAATTPPPPGEGVAAVAAAPGQGQQAEAELAWVDEMYPVSHWGFGRVSFSDPSVSGSSRPTP
ncbi:hypothetical protein U9M48_044915 [Paspalum notatum var. saurae]|uniref:Pollen preferential protein n=1 Tax=Paspalum notatum var. saurae TaxID=547442 RepID=A0AAQ3V0V5_PASNO